MTYDIQINDAQRAFLQSAVAAHLHDYLKTLDPQPEGVELESLTFIEGMLAPSSLIPSSEGLNGLCL